MLLQKSKMFIFKRPKENEQWFAFRRHIRRLSADCQKLFFLYEKILPTTWTVLCMLNKDCMCNVYITRVERVFETVYLFQKTSDRYKS